MSDFDPSLYSRPGMSIEEVLEIREAYMVFEPDKNDNIKIGDLVSSMKVLNFN